jgi:hypothetical protein
MSHHKLVARTDIYNPTFKLFEKGFKVGIANLSEDLTINGTTVEPTFRYEARHATTSGWMPVAGETLTGAGSGGTVDLETPFISDDKAVNPERTRYWQADNNTFADITTEDVVLEAVFKTDTVLTTSSIYGKWQASGGLLLYTNTNSLYIQVRDGTTTVSTSTPGLVEDTWYHVIVFIDRSGSQVVYINGSQGTSAPVSAVGSLTNTGVPATIALEGGGSIYPWGGEIAYAAMWKQSDWLDTHLQETIAKERFAKLTGIYPTKAEGTALPVVASRASVAYLDKEIVGDELLPSTDPTSGWSNFGISAAVSAETHPEGATVYAITEVSPYTQHYASQAAYGTTNVGDLVEMSVDVKKANRDWILLYQTNTGLNYSYFNIDTATAGSTVNTISTKVESLGNDWYRYSFRFRAATDSPTFRVYGAEGVGDTAFTGLDQIMFYIANPSFKNISKQLLPVGNNWMRVCQRTDSEGTSITGYLPEVASTNLLPYSQDFDNAAWAKIQSSISGSAGSAPDGSSNASIIVEDATAAQVHYISDGMPMYSTIRAMMGM